VNSPASGLREEIRQAGLDLGFVRVGFASTAPLPHLPALRRWVDAGMAASMAFLSRAVDERASPAALLPEASVAVVGLASYAAPDPPQAGRGLVARYAAGRDYHEVLRERLAALHRLIETRLGRPVPHRIVVDTAPLLERELAMAAGLGFIGKSTLLVTPGIGSYTVIGTLLLALEVPPDDPIDGGCGDCELCLAACPTRAIVAPRVLDARRCLSYLTIEHRGTIDPVLRAALSPWVFGCDICQEVCPHNALTTRRAALPADPELAPRDRLRALDLAKMLRMHAGEHRRLVRGRALRRASRVMLVRNAALAAAPLLRAGDDSSELRGALEKLRDGPDLVLRDAAAWALDGPATGCRPQATGDTESHRR
jgi:epoxyqueuosine reductase